MGDLRLPRVGADSRLGLIGVERPREPRATESSVYWTTPAAGAFGQVADDSGNVTVQFGFAGSLAQWARYYTMTLATGDERARRSVRAVRR